MPTFNELANLPRLLRSVARQEGVPYEVIVVDQDSDDGTAEVARDMGAEVVSKPRPEFYSPPADSRNAGASVANGELLLHLDADMELPDARFLQRFVRLFDQDHQAVIVHETDIATAWWTRVKAVERACYWNSSLEYARGVSHSLFDEVAGYDAAISAGEDAYIHQAYRAKTQFAQSNDVWVRHHTGSTSLMWMLRKKHSYGRTASVYLTQAEEMTGNNAARSIMWGSLAAYFRHAPAMMVRNPLLFLCVFPMRLLEMCAVRLGIWTADRERKNQSLPSRKSMV